MKSASESKRAALFDGHWTLTWVQVYWIPAGGSYHHSCREIFFRLYSRHFHPKNRDLHHPDRGWQPPNSHPSTTKPHQHCHRPQMSLLPMAVSLGADSAAIAVTNTAEAAFKYTDDGSSWHITSGRKAGATKNHKKKHNSQLGCGLRCAWCNMKENKQQTNQPRMRNEE